VTTFKVVLDGVDLSADQADRLAKSIQRSVMLELAELGPVRTDRADNADEIPAFGLALLTGMGKTMGLVATSDPANLDVLVGNFGSAEPG
jgi:hypothetical protein